MKLHRSKHNGVYLVHTSPLHSALRPQGQTVKTLTLGQASLCRLMKLYGTRYGLDGVFVVAVMHIGLQAH